MLFINSLLITTIQQIVSTEEFQESTIIIISTIGLATSDYYKHWCLIIIVLNKYDKLTGRVSDEDELIALRSQLRNHVITGSIILIDFAWWTTVADDC